MTSLQKYLKQRPTRNFTSIFDNDGNLGAYIFTQANVDTWLSNNAAYITNLGGRFYIIPGTATGTTFYDVLQGDNGRSGLGNSGNLQERKSLLDMGKEIVIGDATESRIVTLRLIRTPVNSQTGQDGEIVYVVVENNAADLPNTAGRFTVRVARI